jgi:hypothetical protein
MYPPAVVGLSLYQSEVPVDCIPHTLYAAEIKENFNVFNFFSRASNRKASIRIINLSKPSGNFTYEQV